MSSKIVKATYSVDVAFCIPKNINLEDETQVKDWGVKWNKLYITLTNGKELKIDCWAESDIDYKYPDNTEITEAEDYGCIDDDDEGFDEVEIKSYKTIHNEKYNNVMNEIKFVRNIYDPLIITLNTNKFWSNFLLSKSAAICKGLTKVDLNYFTEGQTFQDPNSYYQDNKIKIINLKIYGTEIKFK
jgi:hypothetical protein